MPKRPPRHLEPPPRPWRLTLFAFGLTASVLAALVASAALVPHDPAPPTPTRPPGGTPATVPAESAPTSVSTTRPRQPSTTPSPTTPATASLAQPAPSGTPPAVGRTTTGALTTFGATTTQPMVTAPTTTVAPTTTTQSTTTTTESTTTTTEPTTTTTGQPILRGDQAATVSAATATVLLPILGLVHLLRGLVPQPGGRHATKRQQRSKHLCRRG